MILNPFDKELEKAEQKVSDLRTSLNKIRQEIDWFEGIKLDTLINQHEELISASGAQSRKCIQLRGEVAQIQFDFNKTSKSINSLWNPRNWFNQEQRDLRDRRAKLKVSLERAKKSNTKARERMQDIDRRIKSKGEEIARYEKFDFNARRKNRVLIANRLSEQKKKVELITRRKQQVDKAIEPIVKQIRQVERKKSEATSVKRQAQKLKDELSNADNPYERAMVHQACEQQFGTGSPRKIISRKDAEIRRLNRDLKKLEKRARNVMDKVTRDVRKLIVDGNNLCYEGDTFLGLDALRILIPVLADNYEVIVVFDASIRRALDSGDSDVRDVFGNNVKVHISVKADETVLDLARADNTTFIISNDRFAEFREKPAVRDRRLIRHEIVAGQVLIHDLGISETYNING